MGKVEIKLGSMIRECREKKGLTQLELSLKLGYQAPQFVSIVERGLARTPLRTLGELVVILGLSEKKVIQILLEDYREEMHRELESGKRRAYQQGGSKVSRTVKRA